MLFQHAFFAVDFSPATAPCLECLPELTQLGVNDITLVHVLESHYPRAPSVEHVPHYEERLGQLAIPLQQHGITVHTQVCIGDPATEILAAAQKHKNPLVVIGSHGKGLFNRTLMGSVADKVLKQATIPVLLLPIEAVDESEQTCRLIRTDLFTHILHPTDFSDVAERAYSHLLQLVERCSRATVLHVQDDARATQEQRANKDEYDKIDQARLLRLKKELEEKNGFEAAALLEHGSPGETILRVADTSAASLILMGSQGRGYLSEVLLGSAGRYVVRHTRIPVLLIPAPR